MPDAPNALVSVLVSYVGILAMPIAIGIAVTRHRLYEIDRLISRTIGWALVTGVLVLVFAGTVVGLQAILARVTQGETLAVAASTLVAFALFQPVRRRVQTAVDHRFDRARYDGDRTAAAFTERLRDRVDLAGLESEITGVVDAALRPDQVGVWIRRPRRAANGMKRRIVAVAAWLLTVLMNALMIWALISGRFMDTMYGYLSADEQIAARATIVVTYLAMAGIVAVTLAYATVGVLLGWRPGGRRVGAILLAAGFTFTAVPFGYIVGGLMVVHDPLDPIANVLYLIGPATFALAYSLILPVVGLTFPDGHLPSRRWRLPTGIALAAVAGATILPLVTPGQIAEFTGTNPLGIDALPSWLSSLAGPLAGVGVLSVSVLGFAAVVTRYRRGSGIERQQLRWFVAAVLFAVVPITIAPLTSGFGGPAWLLVAELGLLLVPIAIGIAVTRYRLYEIDRLISRGLSWAVLSGLLLAVYGGAILLLQTLLGDVIQGQTVAVAGSTLLAAALFQPLRRRIQGLVDHRFNRARYDAERTAIDFAERLRGEVDVDHLRAALATTAGGAVNPDRVGVWLRPAAEVER